MALPRPVELEGYSDDEPTGQSEPQSTCHPRWLQPNHLHRRRASASASLATAGACCRLLLMAFLLSTIILLILLMAYSTPRSYRAALARAHPRPDATLPYTEYPADEDPLKNTTTSTILLIHGACSSAAEWDLVIPHFPPHYHILVPDLPHHARARAITPFTLSSSSRLIADLIRSRARNGRAHVVGLSLGGHVAINLAASHPDIAQSVLASGWRHWGRPWYAPLIAPVLACELAVEDALPRGFVRWVTGGADVRRNADGGCGLEVVREWVEALTEEVVAPAGEGIEGGVLVVAGTRRPGDRKTDAAMVAGLLRGDGGAGETGTVVEAVYNDQLSHPWNRQKPELFAALAMAWIEGRPLPKGFEKC